MSWLGWEMLGDINYEKLLYKSEGKYNIDDDDNDDDDIEEFR